MSVKVIIVDDHLILRQGLKVLLSDEAGVSVVAEADNGPAALELVGSLKPDVLILDIAMEGMDGLEVTRRVSADFPDVAVIILSMHDEKYYVI